MQDDPQTQKIRWRAPEYDHQEKAADWYWAVGIITLALAATATIFGDLLLGILILLASFILMIYAARRPRMVNVVVDENGVTIGEYHYPFSTLAAFYVENEDEASESLPRLFLQSRKALVPRISIPFKPGEVNPDDIRYFLMDHLDEEEMDDPIFVKMLKKLGF